MQIFSFFPLSKLQVRPCCLLSCLQVLTSVHRLLSALYPDAVSSAAAAACQQVPLCSAGQTHSLQRDNPRSVNLCSIKLLKHIICGASLSWGGVELCRWHARPWRFCPPPTKWELSALMCCQMPVFPRWNSGEVPACKKALDISRAKSFIQPTPFYNNFDLQSNGSCVGERSSDWGSLGPPPNVSDPCIS